jgi:hypothetical protein
LLVVSQRTAALQQRDEFIASSCDHAPGRVWVIITNPRARLARMLLSAGADLVELSATAGTRLLRLAEREDMENGMPWPDVVAKEKAYLKRFSF